MKWLLNANKIQNDVISICLNYNLKLRHSEHIKIFLFLVKKSIIMYFFLLFPNFICPTTHANPFSSYLCLSPQQRARTKGTKSKCYIILGSKIQILSFKRKNKWYDYRFRGCNLRFKLIIMRKCNRGTIYQNCYSPFFY